jgi:hypothetical protein
MMTLAPEFDFLKDTNLDAETKRALLQGLLDEKRFSREAAQKAKEVEDARAVEEKRLSREAEQKAKETEEAKALERKRYWHNTPLMLALVGTIGGLHSSFPHDC